MAKSTKKAKKSKQRTQFAALPFRYSDPGRLEVLLITSRETRRWVIPKGWPIKGLSPARSAAREAFEEAGLEGVVSDQPIGSFQYRKRMRDGASVTCDVDVFPLEVTRQLESWPEQGQRDLRWFGANEAAAAVDEPELARMLRSFGLGHPNSKVHSRLSRALRWIATRAGLARR
jgi:8-oxo-dGTP pyrophosphatase MutT (NUDIX family)